MPFTPQPDYHKAYEAFRPRPFVWPHETADPPTSESRETSNGSRGDSSASRLCLRV